MYAIHPGEIIKDFIEYEDITAEDFAKQIDYPKLQDVIDGKENLNDELILKLHKATNCSIEFWHNLQKIYERDLANNLLDTLWT